MNIHAMFPTLVLEDEIQNQSSMKKTILNTILNHVDKDGQSNVVTGHVNIHHEPLYRPIFDAATDLAKQYCSVMQVDPSLFDFNIVKSWFNILRNGGNPYHAHPDAHLCFCYYANVPKEYSHPIYFYAHPEKYEPYQNFARLNKPAEWNVFNSYGWSFPVSEGFMFMWPARMFHATKENGPSEVSAGIFSISDAKKSRISIAGDILLTYKEKSSADLGLQPKQNWRVFEGRVGNGN
jgi:hypothetical protein